MLSQRLSRDLRFAVICLAATAPPAAAQGTERVSVATSGAQANRNCTSLDLSADGRFVAFWSAADNLVAGDANRAFDVFVRDRATGTTERVSVDSAGIEANADSFGAALSADGRFVAFGSGATNLVAGDVNGALDVFVHDRATGTTDLVSVDSFGVHGDGGSGAPTISADGRLVVFASAADNFDPFDTNRHVDAFLHDRTTGITSRISLSPTGSPANGDSPFARISADGSTVAYGSRATNLVAGDTNQSLDVFVVDLRTGATERASVTSAGGQADRDCYPGGLSADGSVVAFETVSDQLVPGDVNGCVDCFVRDRAAGTTACVSVDAAGAPGDLDSSGPTLSADGRLVAFCSGADDLIAADRNGSSDVFIHDRATGTNERVSVNSSGVPGDADSDGASISADGGIVAFRSFADNLVAGDSNADYDVFVNERCQVDASWSNYGAGVAGTVGVPDFTARTTPVIGTRIALDLANSFANPTLDLLVVGVERTSVLTRSGGHLLVIPLFVEVQLLAASGATLRGDIPHDATLCGVTVDLQAIELDAGAPNGLSFTRGLELTIGR